jgi:hypothetical protein
MRRPVSTPSGLKPSKVAVKSGVVGNFVLPAAPDNPQPSASEGADRMRMGLTPCPGLAVDLLGPRVPVAGGVGEGRDGAPQALVARTPEGRGPSLARLQRDRTHADIGGECRVGRVAPTRVAQLGDQGRGADRRLRIAEERLKDRCVGVDGKGAADLRGELGYLGTRHPQPSQGGDRLHPLGRCALWTRSGAELRSINPASPSAR